MKNKLALILSTILFPQILFAKLNPSYFGSAPDRGIIITINADKDKYSDSDIVKFSGVIKLVGKKADSKDSKKLTLLEEFKKSGLEIVGTFPSDAVDITNSLALTSINENEIKFSFISNSVLAADLNLFSVRVYNNKKSRERIASVLKVMSKLELRKVSLDRLLQDTRRGDWSTASNELFSVLKNGLDAVLKNAELNVRADENLIAERKYALQVGNLPSAPSLSSTIMNKYKLSIVANPGSVFSGRNSQVTTTISNLRKASEDFADDSEDDAELKIVQIIFNGKIVHTSSPQQIPNAKSFTYSFNAENLLASIPNFISAALYSSKNNAISKRLGWITSDIVVVKDSTPPVIATNAASNSITNNPTIYFNVTDESELVSEVYKNGVLALTTSENNFAVQLSEGINNIEVRSKDFSGNIAVPFLLSNIKLDTTLPIINSYNRSSYFLEVIPGVVSFSVYVNEPTKFLKSNGVEAQKISEHEYKVTENISVVGKYNLAFLTQDLAGNLGTLNATFDAKIDDVAPVVTLAQLTPLTNATQVWVSASVDDESATETTLKVNGLEVAKVLEKNFRYLVALSVEGLNTIQVQSKDAAGNLSELISVTVKRDSAPPILSNLLPMNGSFISKMKFNLSGTSNEALSEISVNGMSLTVAADRKSFSGTYVSSEHGALSLIWTAKDVLGNTSRTVTGISLSNSLLVPSLITVLPDTDRVHYKVIGLPGAARSDAEISVSVGPLSFNRGSDIAKLDGTFAVKMDKFTRVTVRAKDLETNETASFELDFNVPTSISGIIKDTNDVPLPGATIRILGSSVVAVTDASGVFLINDAPLGDQTLSIDGSTISQATVGSLRRFSVTNLSIAVSPGIVNSMTRPIYLTATLLDGTGTTVTDSAVTTVTDVNAPGVSISVPRGVAIFPDGTRSGHISMRNISSSRTVLPPPSGFMPDEVIALEPSGLRFSQRVEVTFPNINDLSEGTEVYVLSLNSITGQWEIDGLGKVQAGGQTIKTKPGAGISHFSETFVVPVMPILEAIQDPTLDGMDTSKGAMETSVNLPSFKSLGELITPVMKYKSSWSVPTAFVSNVFDIPKSEVNFSTVNEADSFKTIIKDICFEDGSCEPKKFVQYVYSRSNYNFQSAYLPDQISAQSWVGINSADDSNFEIVNQPVNSSDLPGLAIGNSIKTEKWTLVNDADGKLIPNMSQISFAIPLKKDDQSFLKSGIYPSFTRYQVKLKHLTITTLTEIQNASVNGYKIAAGTFNRTTRTVESNQLERIIPKDISRNILVQNKVNSPIGRGWNFSLSEKMINTKGSKIVLEDLNGQISTYAAAIPIETLFNANGTDVNLQYGAGLNSWPKIFVTSFGSDSIGRVKQIDGTNPTFISNVSQLETLSGTTGFDKVDDCLKSTDRTIKLYKFDFKQKPGIANIVEFPNGRLIATDQSSHSILDVSDAISRSLGGRRSYGNDGFESSNDFNLNVGGAGFEQSYQTTCSTLNLECAPLVNLNKTQTCSTPLTKHDERGVLSKSSSQVPYKTAGSNNADFSGGLVNGSGYFGTQDYGSVGFNSPSGLIISPDGKLVVADTGLNVVYKINLETGTMKVLAGNYVASDTGDGDLAAPNVTYDLVRNETEKYENFGLWLISKIYFQKARAVLSVFISQFTTASIYHPKGLAYDSDGNLYITSENGFIRKVNEQGIISTYAGKRLEDGGVLAENIHAELMSFNNPTGIVIDSDKQAMFVADTGNHRIVKIDMISKVASIIAGNSSCEANAADGGAALNASLCSPTWLGFDNNKNLLILDSGHQRIRRVFLNRSAAPLLTYLPTNNDLSVLEKQANGTFIKKARDGSQVFFNERGFQLASVDRVGRTISYNYDADDRLTEINDPVGRSVRFNYSGTKMISFEDSANRTTSFNYDGDLLSTIVYPDNSRKRFVYDPEGRMTSEFDARENETKYAYNSIGRLTSITDKLGKTSNFSDLVSATHQKPAREGLDVQNVNSNISLPNDNSMKFTADYNGFVRKVMDGSGRQIEVQSDFEGKPIRVTLPDKTEMQYVYSATTKDLLSVKNGSTGLKQSQTFNKFGQMLSKTDFNGNVSQRIYTETAGLLVSEVFPNNIQSTTSYNHLGLPISKTIYPSGQSSITTSYVYDSIGNVITVISADNKTVKFSYDLAGNILSESIISDTNLALTTTYEYDLLNRLTKVISPKGESTLYTYLATGELYQIKDAKDKITLFLRDKKGQLTEKVDPEGNSTIYEYDSVGNVVKEIDPNQQVKIFRYNLSNKIISAQMPDEVINYVYDIKDQVIEVSSSNGSKINYLRDSQSRVIQELNFGDTFNYSINMTYDELGSRTGMTALSSEYTTLVTGPPPSYLITKVNYSYDENNRLRSLSSNWGDVFSFNYDNANRLVELIRPGSKTDFGYNAGSSLASISHNSSGATKSFSEFGYDSRNLIIQKRNPSGTFNYSYDGNGQLTGSEDLQSSANSEVFAYDSIGNRLGSGNQELVYDQTGQRLNEDGLYSYAYDKNGNIISKNSKLGGISYGFEYSSRNQLKRAIVLASPLGLVVKTITYSYDAIGRRITRSVIDSIDSTKSVTKKFLFDGENVIAELDYNNRLMASYTYSPLKPDDILAAHYTAHAVKSANGGDALTDAYEMSPSAGSFYYLKDHINTITEMTNAAGEVVQRYNYSPFGIIRTVKDASGQDYNVATAPFKNVFTYTGREFEPELGVYHFKARYYDPSSGRFLQKDIFVGKLNIPITHVNKYAYTANNPISFNDPSGMSWLSDFWGGANEWAKDLVIAAACVAIIYCTGGVGVGIVQALAAVGSAAGGAAVAAMAVASRQGGNFWTNAENAFHANFRTSATFLALSAVAAAAFGGGVVAAGGNGLNGFVQSKDSFWLGGNVGDLTIGSSAIFNGTGSLAGHSMGHTLQFIGLSFITGDTAKAWTSYLGAGIVGVTPLGGFWESLADILGGK